MNVRPVMAAHSQGMQVLQLATLVILSRQVPILATLVTVTSAIRQ